MKNRLVALIAAVVVGMSLMPPVAGAEDAEGPNPFTLTFANGMCSFGVDDQNPEMKLFRQDSSINRSYVFDEVTKEVPEFAELRAMNPKLEDKNRSGLPGEMEVGGRQAENRRLHGWRHHLAGPTITQRSVALSLVRRIQAWQQSHLAPKSQEVDRQRRQRANPVFRV